MTSLFSVLLKSDQNFKSMSESAIWAILRWTWGHNEGQNAKMQRNLASKKILGITFVHTDACAKPFPVKHSTVLRAAGTLRNILAYKKRSLCPEMSLRLTEKIDSSPRKKIGQLSWSVSSPVCNKGRKLVEFSRFSQNIGCLPIHDFDHHESSRELS